MIKKVTILLIIIVLTPLVTFAQGGICSICDPRGKYANVKEEEITLRKIIGNKIKDITIIEFNGGWKDKEEAKRELMNKLQDLEIKTSSLFLWNMDTPVQLMGIILYSDGSKGKIAVAQHRVGFQDCSGKPWYFQWEERNPFK